jgi:hypothetical protein
MWLYLNVRLDFAPGKFVSTSNFRGKSLQVKERGMILTVVDDGS